MPLPQQGELLTRHPADSCLNPAFPSLILTRDILNEWSSQGEAKGRPMNVVVDTPAYIERLGALLMTYLMMVGDYQNEQVLLERVRHYLYSSLSSTCHQYQQFDLHFPI